MKIAFVLIWYFGLFAHPAFSLKAQTLRLIKEFYRNDYNEAGEAMIPIKEFCRNFPVVYSEAQLMSGEEIERRNAYELLMHCPILKFSYQAGICKYMKSVYDDGRLP